MARPLYYPWDVSQVGRRPLGAMNVPELEVHLALLRARQAELEALDVRLVRNARQLQADAAKELAALKMALAAAEDTLARRRAQG